MTQLNRRNFLHKAGQSALTLIILSELSSALSAKFENEYNLTIEDLEKFAQGLTGCVIYPFDQGYDVYRQNLNKRFNIFPLAIVLAETVNDVAQAVRWCRKHGIQISTRSGGHSYEGFSLSKGVVIDVSKMTDVQIDPSKQTARVQAGIQLAPLYQALWEHSLTISAGSCPSVGIAGFTLGGGFGLLSRKWGLAADNLIELEMVNAAGELLTINQNHHPDLYWACRGGGGGNFGIVTALTFNLHKVYSVVLYEMRWSWEQAPKVIETWQKWAPDVADELTCELSIEAKTNPIFSNGQFLGTEEELRQLLEPLSRLGAPKIKMWTTSFIEAVHYFEGGKGPPFWKAKSDYVLEPLSSQGIQTILQHMALINDTHTISRIQFDNYGGAINRVAKGATAFAHRRGTLYSIQYIVSWNSKSQSVDKLAWLRRFYSDMRPYVSGFAYVNYCDLDLENWQHAYYGSNFSRLTQVKAKYDPKNVFRHAQSIPPA
jgi:FAD/FMN-containing dehydrogenase